MRILSLGAREDGRAELERVGVDPIAIPILLAKDRTYAVSIEDLPCSTANILKQTALALGADCAMHRDVIRGRRRRSRIVLFANRRQLGRICERLLEQPPTAQAVSENLRRLVRQFESRRRVLKVRDIALDLSERTYLMGILNVTPDSFSDGGRFLAPEDALAQGVKLASAGADFIDLGAESTRPGAQPVDAKQELARLLPVLIPLRRRTDAFISIDTYKSETARACLAEGADMINDISGLRFDPGLAGVIARAGAACVVMHIKGKPRTMQRSPKYLDLMSEIFDYLTDCIGRAALGGIAMEQVIVDPGIGFGKSVEDNFTILRRLAEFRSLGQPLMVGPSRKSFIGAALGSGGDNRGGDSRGRKLLGHPLVSEAETGRVPIFRPKPGQSIAEERLFGTVAASVLAVANGANILRVHDVEAVKQAVTVAEKLLGGPGSGVRGRE